MDQKIGFCTSEDGIRICYATVGDGPPLVKAPNWLTHLEFEWQSPIWSHWWEELARSHLLVRFDQRGSGLSDWEVDDVSFEACVSDLEAVGSVSNICEKARKNRTAQVLALIEPAAILVIGSVIGVMMLGVILAITSVNDVAF